MKKKEVLPGFVWVWMSTSTGISWQAWIGFSRLTREGFPHKSLQRVCSKGDIMSAFGSRDGKVTHRRSPGSDELVPPTAAHSRRATTYG